MRLRLLLMIMCFAISLIPIAVISGLQNIQIASAFLGLILAITLMVAYVIAHFISRPLVKLTKNIDEISKGNLDVELEKSEIYEINNLTASLDRVMASLKLAIYKVGLKKEEVFQEVIKEKLEAEKKLEYLLKKIDGWIWEIDENWKIRVCSEKVADALGYTPQQIIGKDVLGFLPPEDALKVKEAINHLTMQKKETTNKIDFQWLHHRDRHPVWIRSYLIPIFDTQGTFHGLRCFSRDITDIYHTQEQIKTLQRQLAQMEKRGQRKTLAPQGEYRPMESSNEKGLMQEFDYMFLCDDHANIIDCTTDIHLKLGYTKDEMLKLTIADVTVLETLEEIRSMFETIRKQGCIDMKTIHRTKDGTSLLVQEHVQYLKERNRFLCLVKMEEK
jgi:PAS domain S-box-containing protein